MLRLAASTRARIDGSLSGWPRASEVRAFVAAVVWQLAHGAGETIDAAEDAAATRVLGLVEAAAGGAVAFEAGAAALANDAVVLSAFFQNLDLLPAEHDPQVDAVAMRVGDAVHRLAQMIDPGPDPV